MRNQFDRQLNTLNGELIQMGHMVEQAIEHAIEAMVHQIWNELVIRQQIFQN